MDSTNTDIGDPDQIISTITLSGSTILEIVGLLLLLLLSALISGSEVALFSLSTEQLNECEKSEDRSSQIIFNLLQKPKMLLASILIFNNLVNVGIVTLSTFISWELFQNVDGHWIIFGYSFDYVWFFETVLVVAAIVFLGEVIPKVYANQKNLAFAKTTSYLLKFINFISWPLSILLVNSTNFIERRIQQKEYDISVQEINQAVDMATADISTKEEVHILKGIVNFGSTTVRQIMRSRLDITAFNSTRTFHEIMDKINKTNYSRIPVYNDTIDHIAGLLYIKDLLPFIEQNEHFKWQKLLRPVYYVPETKKISDLLKNFKEKRVHMAVVVDEYGGTCGIVTLEDILEEIVGEINDEFDDEEIEYSQVDSRTYVFEGKTSLNDFVRIIDVSPDVFEEVKGESESLGGLVLEMNNEMPIAGHTIEYKNFHFTIESVNSKRIKRVRIKINEEAKDEKPDS